jgi:phosphoserine aminotransferase
VRKDLVGHALRICPSAFNYATVAAHGSMYNTPPTWAIYITGLVLDWIGAEGGVAEIERATWPRRRCCTRRSTPRATTATDIAADCRSRMNVPFFLPDDRLTAPFLAGAQERGLLQLKGHKSVGGLRASLYNAMPLEGTRALVAYMREFAARHG